MISKIYILQSFESVEAIKSGRELYEKLKDKIAVYFKDVQSPNDLYEELEKIRAEIISSEELCVIHFDCHGNEDGIELYDLHDNGTSITWEDFRSKFRNIYISSPAKPIISFSSCKGLYVMKLIAKFEPCPYGTIAGCLEDIEFEDSIDAFFLFYISLMSGASVLNGTVDVVAKYPHLKFFGFDAKDLAELGWDRYKKEKLTPEVIKARKDEIISEVIKIKGHITEADFALLERGLTADSGKADHERHREIFNS
ncbi:MAG TPA: hypothetical protein VFE32_19315 [Puia sp.]|jgi:hypothetical protein|nr:hypothetical protein [Puia sp.]